LPKDKTQLLRETGEPCARAEQFQRIPAFGDDCPQDHQPALLVDDFRRRQPQPLQYEMTQAIERKTTESRVSSERGFSEQLALELVSHLTRGEQDQGPAFRGSNQDIANLRQTTESLAAPRWPQQETHAHALSWIIGALSQIDKSRLGREKATAKRMKQ